MTADPTEAISIEAMIADLESPSSLRSDQFDEAKIAAALRRQQAEIERLLLIRDSFVKIVDERNAEISDLRSRLGDSEYLNASYLEDIQDLREKANDLLAALRRIADYPQGQVFSAGFAPDDAENMQELARAAIAKATGP